MSQVPTLLRPLTARLLGFAALALLGALQWRRMVGDVPAGRALAWVAVAVAAAAAVHASARLHGRWAGWAPLGVALAALVAAFLVAPIDPGLLEPARWDELGVGLSSGVEALGTVKLPYEGVDPWPGQVLGLLGALLCVLGGLLALWPRGRTEPGGGDGYPFFALVALLTLVATPVISLGGARPLLLGSAVAALIVCFLWLERLPLRPGFGVAVLLAFALAGGVPLATTADREEPWFDYKSFAESIGPDRPQRFNFDDSQYGPIDWPRDGGEVLRVYSEDPHYLKVQVLDRFDGYGWSAGGAGRDGADLSLADELGPAATTREEWTERMRITVRGLRDHRIAGTGTILDVDADVPVQPGLGPGPWTAERDLRGGDSYEVTAYVPQPSGAELADQPGVPVGSRDYALWVDVPFTDGPPRTVPRTQAGSSVRGAQVRFPAFGEPTEPIAYYPELLRTGSGIAAVRASPYRRSWALARELRDAAQTPYDYVLAVDRYLEDGFRYTERPPEPAPGVLPLESFIHDTKAGYCQQFAGAMALLLRMGGIPARAVNGFSPGGFSERKNAWVVRDTDAHQWVEAWFGEYGWVTFDPTPPATPARSQTAAIVDAAELDDEEVAGVGGVGREARPSGPNVPAGRDGGSVSAVSGEEDAPWWAMLGVGGALVAAAAWLVARRRRERHPALEPALAELAGALRRAGHAPAATTTLQDIERAFGGEGRDYIAALRRARYGGGAVPDRGAGRRALRREIASGGGLRARARALWALPPRP